METSTDFAAATTRIGGANAQRLKIEDRLSGWAER
jgi:hypothetical protein